MHSARLHHRQAVALADVECTIIHRDSVDGVALDQLKNILIVVGKCRHLDFALLQLLALFWRKSITKVGDTNLCGPILRYIEDVVEVVAHLHRVARE